MGEFFSGTAGRLTLAVAALVVIVLGAGIWYVAAPKGAGGPLAAIKNKGTLTIGVRSGAPPFSDADGAGGMVGFEPDIAKALAGDLGVKANFVAVDPASAMDYLARGVIDVAVLPLPEGESDTEAVTVVTPGYFASGLTIIARRGSAPQDWDGLAGAAVCGLESAVAGKQVVEELGAKFISFQDPQTALGALEAERCSAYIGDEVWVRALLVGELAERFEVPLGTIDIAPWNIAVRTEDGALAAHVANLLEQWHASGFLLDQAATWRLPENPYLLHMRSVYLGGPLPTHEGHSGGLDLNEAAGLGSHESESDAEPAVSGAGE